LNKENIAASFRKQKIVDELNKENIAASFRKQKIVDELNKENIAASFRKQKNKSMSSISPNSQPQQLDDDEFIWSLSPIQPNTLTRHLQSYEQGTLHCPLCHQFFKNAVTLRPCHHVFCSECIRKALRDGNQRRRTLNCPFCKVEVMKGKEDNYFVPNWGLQSAVNAYKDLRSSLYQNVLQAQNSLTHIPSQQVQVAQESSSSSTTSLSSTTTLTTTIATATETSPNDAIKRRGTKRKANDEIYIPLNNNGSSSSSTPGTERGGHDLKKRRSPRGYPKENFSYAEEEEKEPLQIQKGDEQLLKPSVTNVPIAVPSIPNPYKKQKSVTLIQKPPMKRMASYRLYGMKRTQLDKLCNEHGLPTNGNDEDKKSRLKKFVDLYNAECDAEFPRSKQKLVNELRQRELNVKKEARQLNNYKNCLEKLKENRKDGSSAAKSGNKAFDDKLQNGFKDLIEKMKKRHQTKSKTNDTKSNDGNEAGGVVIVVDQQINNVSVTDTDTDNNDASQLQNMQTSSASAETTTTHDSATMQQPLSTSVRENGLGLTNDITVTTKKGFSTISSPDVKSNVLPRTTKILSCTSKTKMSCDINASTATPLSLKSHRMSSPTVAQQTISSSSSTSQQWKCHRCTFLNTVKIWSNTKQRCKMCDSPKKEKVATSSSTSSPNEGVGYVEIDC